MRYDIDPPDLLSHCDGCGAAFTICHALEYKKGGLIMASHNELRDGVASLAGKAFNPTHMHNDPKIFTGRALLGEKAKAKGKAAAKEK